MESTFTREAEIKLEQAKEIERQTTAALTRTMFFVFKTIFGGILFNLLWCIPVMWAWNYVMPYLFNLPNIGYLHSFCLLFILSTLWKLHIVSLPSADYGYKKWKTTRK